MSLEELLKHIDGSDTNRLNYLLNEMQLKLNKEEYDGVIFCTVITFYIESLVQDLVEVAFKKILSKDNNTLIEFFNHVISESSLAGKIKCAIWLDKKFGVEKVYKEFFSFCSEVNEIRNQLFHLKFKNLTYRGMPIFKIEAQRKMFKDLLILVHNTNEKAETEKNK